MEGKKVEHGRVEALEKDLDGLKGRYEASLEMLGEKEEEVAELRGDVVELKRIYRELVEVKVGGGGK
jgi:chromosome segregation ATPase